MDAQTLSRAIGPDPEPFRALMPCGYDAVALAYQEAARHITAASLSAHYTDGLSWFHQTFIPHIKKTLASLSGGAWNLDDFVAFAAGSDVDFISHVVEAVASEGTVSLLPGGWYGFRVGCAQQQKILWSMDPSSSDLACLCVPSVRNGQVTSEMLEFLQAAPASLLNINLFPTLAPQERHDVAQALNPILDRAILSISFSRGFGLTASQLGVALVHRDHPMLEKYKTAWRWFTYFHNAIAARAFMHTDLDALQTVDASRRLWVQEWLQKNNLPAVDSGSYYVRSFHLSDPVPDHLAPLCRDPDAHLIRLCFKPPQT